jgi:hypothetical protein
MVEYNQEQQTGGSGGVKLQQVRLQHAPGLFKSHRAPSRAQVGCAVVSTNDVLVAVAVAMTSVVEVVVAVLWGSS